MFQLNFNVNFSGYPEYENVPADLIDKYKVEAQFQGTTETKTSILAVSFVFIFFLLTSPNQMFSFLLSLETVSLIRMIKLAQFYPGG